MKTFQRTGGLRKILYFFTCSFLLNMEEPLGYKLKSILPCVVDLRLPSNNEELKFFKKEL